MAPRLQHHEQCGGVVARPPNARWGQILQRKELSMLKFILAVSLVVVGCKSLPADSALQSDPTPSPNVAPERKLPIAPERIEQARNPDGSVIAEGTLQIYNPLAPIGLFNLSRWKTYGFVEESTFDVFTDCLTLSGPYWTPCLRMAEPERRQSIDNALRSGVRVRFFSCTDREQFESRLRADP
jgi:hypothetical protein